jgi:hypothetical protein
LIERFLLLEQLSLVIVTHGTHVACTHPEYVAVHAVQIPVQVPLLQGIILGMHVVIIVLAVGLECITMTVVVRHGARTSVVEGAVVHVLKVLLHHFGAAVFTMPRCVAQGT